MAANALILAGPSYNLLGRSNLITAVDSDAIYSALTALYDNVPSVPPFKFGSRSADRYFVIDIDGLDGFGSFDTWGAGPLPNGWTQLVAGITQENVVKVAGASALKLNNGGAVTRIIPDAKTGEWRQLSGFLRGNNSPQDVARVRIQNLQTFRWLQPNGTWGAAPADILVQQSGAGPATQGYTAMQFPYQVEPFSTCFTDTVQLQVTCICTGTGFAYFDSIIDTPGVNAATVNGHNCDPGIVPSMLWSDDNAAFTQAAAGVVYQPSFYVSLPVTQAPLYHRYWKVLFTGTNSVQTGTIWLSELVLGQYTALQRGPNMGLEFDYVPNSVAIGASPGHVSVMPLGSRDPRNIAFKFRLTSTSSYLEHLSEFVLRIQLGVFPAVFIPNDADPRVCVLGPIMGKKAFQQQLLTMWDCDGGMIELPFGTGIS